MNRCVFCDIAAGVGEAAVLYRDDLVIAFLDINPINPGHLLVVPQKHAARLADLDPAAGERIFSVGQKAASALYRSELRCEGVNLFLADGHAAGQEIHHVHLHVLPRFQADGFRIIRRRFGAAGQKPEQLVEVATVLRGLLSA